MIGHLPRDQFDALYTVIVHGTRFGSGKGSWWRRESTGDVPFVHALDERLADHGVEARVWQHCEELGMEEFEWSGDNRHEARLEGGRLLATYLNEVQRRHHARTGRHPVFNLIGHSHGGNVILASLGHLENSTAILAIHFYGTPFMIYRERFRWLRPEYWGTSRFGHRNIYLTGSPGNTFLRFWSTIRGRDAGASDEPEVVFRFLAARNYLRREIRDWLLATTARPRWRRYRRQPVWHPRWSLLLDSGFVGADIVGVVTKEPSPAALGLSYLRQVLSHLSWPVRRGLALPLSVLLARWSALRVYSLATGLDPSWFSPKRLIVSNDIGFSAIRFLSSALGEEETDSLLVAERTEVAPTEDTADEEPVHLMRRLVLRLAAQVELDHSAYYRSRTVIDRTAGTTAKQLATWGFWDFLDSTRYHERIHQM